MVLLLHHIGINAMVAKKEAGEILLIPLKNIYLKLNDKGYNENYYFDKNTKLIINGKTIDLPLESINVDELEGDTIWYSNVLEMIPELQNIKIKTSQETKKENTDTKVKTGDNTKYKVYMGLIGLSLLGAYCIIMKNYIH